MAADRALPFRPGSQAHRLLALTTPEPTPLDELAARMPRGVTILNTAKAAHQCEQLDLLIASGRRRGRGRAVNTRSYAITPKGQRVLALLGLP
ncbi:hypothetical protein [Deinococcus petrolearius]|uniref:Transcriptional regulator n=1 Tax=Deinococcus petrolearius TaxID=1751295 RepID=A0ABW1DFW6_9DEIO